MNRNKEEELERVTELKKLQSEQAEKALEDFKRQVEHNSSRMFEDMKTQMQKVELDLRQSKTLRQAQTGEYARQLEQEQERCQTKVRGKALAFTEAGFVSP